MSWIGWPTLLFILKWVFLALIYFVLVLLVVIVRKEMSIHVKAGQRMSSIAPGRLRVLQPGSDPKIPYGSFLQLQPETRIGAQPDNDIVLIDQYISGHHTRLRWDGSTWWVEDLGSRNGTYLNGHQCAPHQAEPVTSGASLQMGDMIFELLD